MTLRRAALFFSILGVLAAGLAWSFLRAGDWLVVQDSLSPADVIVVLSGRMPARALEAARLYRENMAAQIWISKPISPAAELEEMHIAFVGEDFYNERVLMAQGVPADAIRILEDPSADTQQEIDEIARDCRRDHLHRVIIVTSKPHTRRVRFLWKRRVGKDPQLIVRYVRDDSFDAAHWWRNTRDGLDVVREWLGIANGWLGFPAQPRPEWQ